MVRVWASGERQEGVALLHMFETLKKPAFFDNFLEGMTHVVEVARYHPDFRAANIHTCLDQEALDKGAAYSYFNFLAFGAEPGVASLSQLSEPHKDWLTAMEFGHDGQVHHPMLVREVAHMAKQESAATPLQQALLGEFSCAQDDVVVVVAADGTQDAAAWKDWSGAQALAERDDFSCASLYEAMEADAAPYRYVMRAELEALSAVDLDSLAEQLAEVTAAGGSSVVVLPYRSLIHVPKGGTPVDLLFAERAKSEAESS